MEFVNLLVWFGHILFSILWYSFIELDSLYVCVLGELTLLTPLQLQDL
jgi:hypothetical protein